MRLSSLAALGSIALLAACEPSTTRPVSTPPPSKAPKTALETPPRAPEAMVRRSATVHMAPGLEGVIGATSAGLAKLFGPPRLDVLEGDARKLQFAGDTCVLDVYLYPKAHGAEPEATYTEARSATTGQAMDSVACVNALKPPAPAETLAPAAPPTKARAKR
jgi:hypothetical protein